MNVTFEDSFWKSLKTLSRHQTWWYKTYDFFRRGIPNFVKNVWFFRKQLWDFRSWDYSYNLQLFARSLEATSDLLENYGNEVEKTRNKKVLKIKRVIYLLHRIRTEDHISDAEKELGELKNTDSWFDQDDTPEEKEHNRKVFNRATELENMEYEELWQILKGQDKEDFNKIYENLSDEEKMKFDHWENWFDGSGIKNWWD